MSFDSLELILTLLAQIDSPSVAPSLTGGAGGAGGPASSIEVQSVWDFVLKGGVMMIPIGICSLIALTVAIERMVSLRRRRVIPPGFMPTLRRTLQEGNKAATDTGRAETPKSGGALEYCRKNGSPLANIFAAGLRRIGSSVETIERHIEEAGQREVIKLRRNLRVFSVIAAVTPLMGLLGTIFGMIRAFQTVAMSADALGKTELLAEGIYEAMITTAAGLIVAIPALIMYHWLAARIQKLVLDMDQMTVAFIDDLIEPAGAHTASNPDARRVSSPTTTAAAQESADPGFDGVGLAAANT